MKYTVDQYKSWIKDFIIDENMDDVRADIINKEYVYEADLLNDDTQSLVTTISDLLVNHICANLKTRGSIKVNILMVRRLMEWFYTKGMIKWNPFEDKRLSISSITALIREQQRVKIYTDKDVEKIIRVINKKLDYPEFSEVMVRLFYEGVPNVSALCNIKNADIDINGSVIRNDDINIKISENLQKAISKYQSICKIEYEKFTIIYDSVDDRLLKASHYSNDALKFNLNQFKININSNYFSSKISNVVGYKVSPRDLYISGFLNYFKMRTKNDQEIYYNTFSDADASRCRSKSYKLLLKELSDIMFDYNGVRKEGKKIKNDCSLYITGIGMNSI